MGGSVGGMGVEGGAARRVRRENLIPEQGNLIRTSGGRPGRN